MIELMRLSDRPGSAPEPVTVDAAARSRVSGAGMRAFLAIGDSYGLSVKDRIALLGDPPRSTYFEWARKAKARAPLQLPLDVLTRISGILGIHKALGILFPEPEEAMAWLKGPHHGTVFGGQAPLDVAVRGGLDGILTVRRYLDAWRGGARGGPGAGADFEPVRDDDLIVS